MEARPHILLVDDSALVLDALRLLFQENGYDVSIARSVTEAVETATSRTVDVMLLDLTLPDGDGLEALARLRAQGSEPRVTAALTGREAAEVEARCLRAGCRAVLVKPVPIAKLIAQVHDWTSEPSTGTVAEKH